MIETHHGRDRTSQHITLPNFIIVAAGKSGTSSLAKMLSRHPQVFLARREVHFFDNDAAYEKGPEFYASHFRAAHDVIAIGEKTPKYTQHFNMPHIAERIHHTLGPKIKLIWILRNPATRAFSHYRHLLTAYVPDRDHVFRGLRPMPFRDVIRGELDGTIRPLLVSRGCYSDQLEIFAKYFAIDNMHFILFEDFVRNPAPWLRDVFSFLGVDQEFDTRIPVEHHNASVDRLPDSLISRSSARLVLLALRGRSRAKHQLYRSAVRVQIRSCMVDVPTATLSELRDYYAPKNRLLAERIRLDISSWM